ncbi:MAG: hypothetical protein NC181_05330 [Clostridium sp.]|nr:hypothetical protein [Clostridium sp.]
MKYDSNYNPVNEAFNKEIKSSSENNKKGNNLNKAIIILGIILIGCISFMAYNKTLKTDDTNKNTNKNDEIKELDINSDLVKNLVYPDKNQVGVYIQTFDVSKISEDYYNADYLGYLAYSIGALDVTNAGKSDRIGLKLKEEGKLPSEITEFKYVTSESMKKGLEKVFGPDIKYEELGKKCGLSIYDSFCFNNSRYYLNYDKFNETSTMDNKKIYSKVYRAEQKDDEIYVYMHVVMQKSTDSGKYIYIYGDEVPIKCELKENELDTKCIEELIKENKIYTHYKYTFKKQSDGNYYLYSGAWEVGK